MSANSFSLEAQLISKDINKYFEERGDDRFKVETIIGQGAWGATLKVKTRDKMGPSPLRRGSVTKFVMKRALHRGGERNIEVEIDFLERLRGAKNIQQLYRISEEKYHSSISGLQGPVLLTEWINHGLITGLINRAADWGQPLPNRLLWRLFLSLVRMVVAMAWPPGGGPIRTETLPPRDRHGNLPPKSRLIHGDLNIQNVMIGNFEPGGDPLVPILKLIDFGSARELPESTPEDAAVKENTHNIGTVLLAIIGGSHKLGAANMKVRVRGEERVISSFARDLDGLNPRYGAPPATVSLHQQKMENLDEDLRNLLAQCLASKPVDRPELEDLVEEVERNVEQKQQDHYRDKRYHSNESNAKVQAIAKDLMCNGNT